LALRSIFHSSVHQLAKGEYTPEQIAAWAPAEFDQPAWISSIQKLQPWVVEIKGELVAFADLQEDGYIDHFYVSGHHGRKGIGTVLMAHILSIASQGHWPELYSKVSFTAQPLFMQNGFEMISTNVIQLRGVEISNVTMYKQIIV